MTTSTLSEFQELEHLYQQQPNAYRRRVKRLIALGYGYVLVSVLVIAGLVVSGAYLFGTGTLKLMLIDEFLQFAIPAVAIAGLMLRAVFVKVPPPDGIYLSGELKQQVIRFFEDVRQKANGLDIDDVVVVNDLNAAVAQRARFGLFGKTRNYLILGLPLLQLMNKEEVNAVVAHEFGHLSHEHGRMGATVYRLEHTLSNVASTLNEKTRKGVHGFGFKFFHWFYPKFDTLTFAMRRGQEYEADEVAARATDAQAIASSLCKLHALDAPLRDHWDSVWQDARRVSSNADISPFKRLGKIREGKLNNAEVATAVDRALRIDTDFSDTHPCLRERLEALDVPPVRNFDETGSAFEAIFTSEQQKQLIEHVEAQWRQSSADAWRHEHAQFQEADRELADLKARSNALEPAELYRLAQLEESLEGTESSRVFYRQLVDQHADNAMAQFQWGRVNLTYDLDTAESALFKSAELDIDMTRDVHQLLEHGYQLAGQPERMSRFSKLQQRYQTYVESVAEETGSLSTDDELMAADVSAEVMEAFQQQLKEHHPEIVKLYVVRKALTQREGDSMYLFAYLFDVLHDNLDNFHGDEWYHDYTRQLVAHYPMFGTPFSLVLDKKSTWLEHLDAIPGSVVHERIESGKERLKRYWNYLQLAFGAVAIIAVIVLLILAAVNGEFG